MQNFKRLTAAGVTSNYHDNHGSSQVRCVTVHNPTPRVRLRMFKARDVEPYRVNDLWLSKLMWSLPYATQR